jgi:hypothetical protein
MMRACRKRSATLVTIVSAALIVAVPARAADPPVAGVLNALTVARPGVTAGGSDALIAGNFANARSGSSVAFAGDFKQRALLLAAGRGGRERALGESLAVVAAGAVGELSVDDRAAERAFGGIVGRFDRGVDGEGPQRGPDLEEVVGESSVMAGAFALAGGVFEQRSEC